MYQLRQVMDLTREADPAHSTRPTCCFYAVAAVKRARACCKRAWVSRAKQSTAALWKHLLREARIQAEGGEPQPVLVTPRSERSYGPPGSSVFRASAYWLTNSQSRHSSRLPPGHGCRERSVRPYRTCSSSSEYAASARARRGGQRRRPCLVARNPHGAIG